MKEFQTAAVFDEAWKSSVDEIIARRGNNMNAATDDELSFLIDGILQTTDDATHKLMRAFKSFPRRGYEAALEIQKARALPWAELKRLAAEAHAAPTVENVAGYIAHGYALVARMRAILQFRRAVNDELAESLASKAREQAVAQ